MKKLALYVLCFSLLLAFVGCGNEKKENYAGFQKSSFIVLEEKDTHSGFHGDGMYYLVLDCSQNKEVAMEHLNEWNTLPLSRNLELMLYGGTTEEIVYMSEIASSLDIPRIENGYYYFCDRHSESTDTSDDTNLLSRGSFNFTLAIYDSDTDRLYYVDFDT